MRRGPACLLTVIDPPGRFPYSHARLEPDRRLELDLSVHPLDLSRWNDLERVFLSTGCSQARGCWCMYYRESGKVAVPPGTGPSEFRRQRLRELAASGTPPGLLGYIGNEPVGWVSLGPRSAFLKLARSPVLKPVDDIPVWSLVCFVVAGQWRRRGVAEALLGSAVRYAREQGADILEAYPVDKPEPGRDDSLWFGSKSMYDRAGFVEVARRRPERPIVRLLLAGGSQ